MAAAVYGVLSSVYLIASFCVFIVLTSLVVFLVFGKGYIPLMRNMRQYAGVGGRI
jgi:hypothetical protein